MRAERFTMVPDGALCWVRNWGLCIKITQGRPAADRILNGRPNTNVVLLLDPLPRCNYSRGDLLFTTPNTPVEVPENEEDFNEFLRRRLPGTRADRAEVRDRPALEDLFPAEQPDEVDL